jgi:uncharacterized protein
LPIAIAENWQDKRKDAPSVMKAFSPLFLKKLRNPSLNRRQQIFLGLCGVIFLLSVYVHFIEPTWYDLKRVRLTLPNLARDFDNYRIVQISDIHADFWMTRKRLGHIVDLINQQQPDLVVLTGDYITGSARRFSPTLKILARLNSSDGEVAVLGNHDVSSNPKVIRKTLEKSGITVLENQAITLQRNDAVLAIGGVGDVWYNQADLNLVLQALPASGAAILLAHEPDFADISAATGRFDLQLSGHSHGGQVYFPFIKRVLPNLAHRYPVGQYQVNRMIQYTNRGVGMSPFHLRFNCRPEITVFTLATPRQKQQPHSKPA